MNNTIDINKLKSTCLGDEELVRKMVQHFRDLVAEQIPLLEQAVAGQNADAVRQISHGVKGAAAYLAAEQTRKLAADLEILGRAGNLEAAPQLLTDLQAEMSRVLNELGAAFGDSSNTTKPSENLCAS